MFTLLKILGGIIIAIGILAPRADTCECKAKGSVNPVVPSADTCECKAKST
jgi:hypothetical protein